MKERESLRRSIIIKYSHEVEQVNYMGLGSTTCHGAIVRTKGDLLKGLRMESQTGVCEQV